MVLAMVPALAEDPLSGTCGAGVTWKLTQNNTDTANPTYTLTISGSGAMADYDPAGAAPWCSALTNDAYKTQITKIVIGKDITTIGNNAFVWVQSCSRCHF